MSNGLLKHGLGVNRLILFLAVLAMVAAGCSGAGDEVQVEGASQQLTEPAGDDASDEADTTTSNDGAHTINDADADAVSDADRDAEPTTRPDTTDTGDDAAGPADSRKDTDFDVTASTNGDSDVDRGTSDAATNPSTESDGDGYGDGDGDGDGYGDGTDSAPGPASGSSTSAASPTTTGAAPSAPAPTSPPPAPAPTPAPARAPEPIPADTSSTTTAAPTPPSTEADGDGIGAKRTPSTPSTPSIPSTTPGPVRPDPIPTPPPTPTIDPAGGGWLDGKPPAGADADVSAGRGPSLRSEASPATTTVASPELARTDDYSVAPPGPARPGAPIDCCPEPPVQGPLRAGSIDDGADVDRYLDYRTRITDAGVATRPLDVFDSTVITVTGADGRPVLDARITVVSNNGAAIDLRSTATGSVRFLPNPLDAAATTFTVTVATEADGDQNPKTVDFNKGQTSVDVTLDTDGGVVGPVPLDVHFVLDATGSMSSQIAQLRTNMASIADQIAALPSQPDTRFGMTIYRDEGDTFVTRTFDLTNNLSAFQDALALVVANGGGDYAEAMDEAIAEALEQPSWRRDGAVELMITVADAPPQVARQVAQGTNDSAAKAAQLGVKILPIAVAGADDQTEFAMREMAFVTGGRFVFLSDGQTGTTTTGERTDITPDDFSELPLDELVVKLVTQELAGLS